MIKLFVTRHGETVWNKEKRLQGWKDSSLTDSGVKNATLLGERLKDTEFQAIYASPSSRAMMTAQHIRGDRNQTIIADDNLREMNLGDWEGLTHEYIQGIEPDNYYAFWNTPQLYKTNTGENFNEFRARVQKVIDKIVTENEQGNILIVTHAVFIKTLLTLCKCNPIEKLWEPPFIHDTSLTIIEVNNGTFDIKLEGDVSHRAYLD